MTKSIEYRVRAVTRYVVTGKVGNDSPHEFGEFANVGVANEVAKALADTAKGGEFFQYEGPPPGKVMRCKVSLTSMTPNVHLVYHETGGRRLPHGESDSYPDPTDPVNYQQDGVNVNFNAVWGGSDPEDGGNAARENRIFNFASPYVNFNATVRNKDVTDKLEVGTEYYVDFIPAPKP